MEEGILLKATGLAWKQWQQQHPKLAGEIGEVYGDVPRGIVRSLKRDSQYDALIKQTEIETDISKIVAQILPLVGKILGS